MNYYTDPDYTQALLQKIGGGKLLYDINQMLAKIAENIEDENTSMDARKLKIEIKIEPLPGREETDTTWKVQPVFAGPAEGGEIHYVGITPDSRGRVGLYRRRLQGELNFSEQQIEQIYGAGEDAKQENKAKLAKAE